jgi:hypothetical protein
VVVHHTGGRGTRVISVSAYAGKRRIGRAHSGRLRIKLTGFPRRSIRVKFVIREVRAHHIVRRRMFRTLHVHCRKR